MVRPDALSAGQLQLGPPSVLAAGMPACLNWAWIRPTLTRWLCLLAGVLAWGVSFAASAQAFQSEALVPEKSSVRFEYKVLGLKMYGKFKTVSARVKLNTARLDQAEASLTIDLTSIDTGWSKINQELMGQALTSSPTRSSSTSASPFGKWPSQGL